MKALATGSSHSLPDMGLLLPSGVPVDVTPEQFLQLMNLGLEGGFRAGRRGRRRWWH